LLSQASANKKPGQPKGCPGFANVIGLLVILPEFIEEMFIIMMLMEEIVDADIAAQMKM
jgi:hypothetical protein